MAAHTDIGPRKKSNQDAYCFLCADSSFGEVSFAVICDGVGGLSAGELASAVVVRRFAEWFERRFAAFAAENVDAGLVDLSALEDEWGQMLADLNTDIGDYAEQRGASMGTTFTGMLLCQGGYFVAHVGDCRAYRLHQGTLTQLTTDQTLMAREIARGNITEEEAEEHPQKNVILQAVGAQQELSPEYVFGRYDSDDLFMMCCDGLYRSVDAEHLRSSLLSLVYAGEREMTSACEQLVKTAIENGSNDNVTVLCFTNAELAVPSRILSGTASGLSGGLRSAAVRAGQDDEGDNPTIVLEDGDAPTTVLEDCDAPTTTLEDIDNPQGSDAPTVVLDDIDAPTEILDGSLDNASADDISDATNLEGGVRS